MNDSSEIPVAKVNSKRQQTSLFKSSRMWWLTLICLVCAVLFAWMSIPPQGQSIRIRFPEGHGLKAGDSVRFRGIEVGRVTSVGLTEDLSAVDVTVELPPGKGRLDVEGTRFWIVRPRLSLTEIRGLETAVGAKYIGVSPGLPGSVRQTEFTGLAVAPPDELAAGGIKLILRSDHQHGVTAGSPLTWRGLEVGQVLSSSLSPDARFVDFSVRIDRPYRKLVRPSSRFWLTSGFGMDVGLTGLKLNADSLTSIVRGGIAFTTSSGSEQPVKDGHVFLVQDKPDDNDLQMSQTVPFVDLDFPATIDVFGKQESSFLGIRREVDFNQLGTPVLLDGQPALLTATLPAPEGVLDFQTRSPQDDGQIGLIGETVEHCEIWPGGGMVVPWPELPAEQFAEVAKVESPSDLVAVRTVRVAGGVTTIIQVLESTSLQPGDGVWQVATDNDLTSWHGAPVVTATDGKLVGVLIAADGETVISRPN